MTFIKEVENDVMPDVADWAVETIQEIVNELMPDGRPFFQDLPTTEERIKEYLPLRGNPEAWTKWIAEQAGEIINKLSEASVPPDDILSVHPVDIAQKFAVAYSAEMEELLQKEVANGLLI